MQIKHVGTIHSAASTGKASAGNLQPCVAVAFSPDGCKLAAAMSDNVIHLFDDIGQKKDRFATKSADPKVALPDAGHMWMETDAQ